MASPARPALISTPILSMGCRCTAIPPRIWVGRFSRQEPDAHSWLAPQTNSAIPVIIQAACSANNRSGHMQYGGPLWQNTFLAANHHRLAPLSRLS